jgi:hypothetical protein
MKLLGRGLGHALGAGVVALVVLFPKTTEAEAVEDAARMGEWEDEGQRFGSILVHGELVASANAPGGWTLVRTYENKSDQAAECTLEERIESTESMNGARVTPPAVTVLARTQTLKLGPNEKKSIGTYIPAALGVAMTKAKTTQAWASAQLAAGRYDNEVSYAVYDVQYLRPLAPGETAAVHHDELAPLRPARLPAGPMIRADKLGAAKAKAAAEELAL